MILDWIKQFLSPFSPARLFQFVKAVYINYARNNGPLTAAAISYYGLVSIIPLLLLAISLFGYTLRSHSLGWNETIQLIHSLVPWPTKDIETLLRNIDSAWSASGLLGLIFLSWAGSQFFHVLSDALNRTWGASSNRPFWKGRLIAFGIMGLGGILLLISLALSNILLWIQSHRLFGMKRPLSEISFIWHAAGFAVPLLFSIITFILIYRILPNAKVTWRESTVGGIFTGILWELAKIGYNYYVQEFAFNRYRILYGPLGSLILLVLWMSFSANIFVLGGEVAHTWCLWNTPARKGLPRRRRPLTPRRRRGFRRK